MKRLKLLAAFFVVLFSPIASVAQTAPDVPVTQNEYQLGPGDELRITVFNEPDLSVQQQRVSAQGDVAMPLIGDIRAYGQTTTELQRSIEAKLSDGLLIQPRVSVAVLTYRPFYVVGEVSRPGAYPFQANLTVPSAIATAGGYARGASRGRVFVRREGEAQEVAYSAQTPLALHPGDTVRVGQGALSALRDLPIGLLGFLP
jgi:protein involved in polysaccharide export with SLBB domain